MILPDSIGTETSAADTRELLAAAGWTEIGLGDWSWVLADPSGLWAARVTPFDPAYRLHAEACLAGAPNRWLARVAAIRPLRRDGHVVVMERLHPADPDAAAAFCAALGIRNESGYAPPTPGRFDGASDPALADLRTRMLTLIAEGRRRYRLWGGADIRPGNVMADGVGRLKLVDPVFLRGRAILQAIVEGRRESLADFTREQLEDFLTIPVFASGEETAALRRRLATLYGAEDSPSRR